MNQERISMKNRTFTKKAFVIKQYSTCRGNQLISMGVDAPILQVFDNVKAAAVGLTDHKGAYSGYQGALVHDIENDTGVLEMLRGDDSFMEIQRFWIASVDIADDFNFDFFTEEQYINFRYVDYSDFESLMNACEDEYNQEDSSGGMQSPYRKGMLV